MRFMLKAIAALGALLATTSVLAGSKGAAPSAGAFPAAHRLHSSVVTFAVGPGNLDPQQFSQWTLALLPPELSKAVAVPHSEKSPWFVSTDIQIKVAPEEGVCLIDFMMHLYRLDRDPFEGTWPTYARVTTKSGLSATECHELIKQKIADALQALSAQIH
jgi:hypothetical protein